MHLHIDGWPESDTDSTDEAVIWTPWMTQQRNDQNWRMKLQKHLPFVDEA